MTTTLDQLIRDKIGPDGDLRELAARCGLSVRQLYDLRNGLVKRPHGGTILALSVGLRVSRAKVRAALGVA